VCTVICDAAWGEERLQKGLAETKAELHRLRGWIIGGKFIDKDLSVVSLVTKLVGTDMNIPLE
jgi:hypothetical protein